MLLPSSSSCDVLIIGGGMLGLALANALAQDDKRRCSPRCLVLESGPIVFADHIKNLAFTPDLDKLALLRTDDFISNDPKMMHVPGLLRALGGRSLIWDGWTPIPSTSEFLGWPPALTREMVDVYLPSAAQFFNASRASSNCVLHRELADEFVKLLGRLDYSATLEAPLLAKGFGQTSPFTPVSEFVKNGISERLVTDCTVLRLETSGGNVVGLHTSKGFLEVGSQTKVVLATGTFESTRLVQQAISEKAPVASRLNLHGISQTTFQVSRARWKQSEDIVEFSQHLLRGHCDGRHLQVQIVAISCQDTGVDRATLLLSREGGGLRGADLFDRMLPDVVNISLIGLCELQVVAKKERPIFNLSDFDRGIIPDLQQVAAHPIWDRLDALIRDMEAHLCGIADYDSAQGNDANRSVKGVRTNILVHESSTLPIGENPDDSVCDLTGRVHGLGNLWVAGTSTFPSAGAHNGTLLALAMTLRLADHFRA